MAAKTIVIDGVGGQGVRVIGNTMASLLAVMGYEVTLLFDYDSSVRGGMSEAFLTWDREPISNFVVECADVVLRLADRGPTHLTSDYVIADCDLIKPGEVGEEIPFLQLGVEKFGRDLFGNMIALGRMLCVCDIEFTDQHLTEALPKKYVEDNIAAIKYGYAMDQESIRAIVPEQAASNFAERYAERVLAGTAPAEAVEQAAALRG
ncbi:MAG TPA: 2-oxoacid:acceptor oxidoreductase family protein [Candidatus Limnocylindrales bacterium]|jgi:Pyruvate/2-oxoacid:ferredoxin oxidoreductase gamma subunit